MTGGSRRWLRIRRADDTDRTSSGVRAGPAECDRVRVGVVLVKPGGELEGIGGAAYALKERDVASFRLGASSRRATRRQARRACCIGWPVPRSVASDQAATTSASRIPAVPGGSARMPGHFLFAGDSLPGSLSSMGRPVAKRITSRGGRHGRVGQAGREFQPVRLVSWRGGHSGMMDDLSPVRLLTYISATHHHTPSSRRQASRRLPSSSMVVRSGKHTVAV
ncbi:MAG: hypothetical protein QOF01_2540 [Thermomicrobiales bacterium]|nr:hypothetical protein [Thermomicrobiales bacterium]